MPAINVNVRDEAIKLIDELRREGFGGLQFPEVHASCPTEWNHSYAVLGAVYWDYPDSDYFDHGRFERDFLKHVQGRFPECTVNFRKGCQEMEIYYLDPLAWDGD